jgi:hypothetical protein
MNAAVIVIQTLLDLVAEAKEGRHALLSSHTKHLEDTVQVRYGTRSQDPKDISLVRRDEQQ